MNGISLNTFGTIGGPTSRPPVPCILQILATFNLYSGRSRAGLSVSNKQRSDKQLLKFQEGRGGGLTIGGLSLSLRNLPKSVGPGPFFWKWKTSSVKSTSFRIKLLSAENRRYQKDTL